MTAICTVINNIKPHQEFVWKKPYTRHRLDPHNDIYVKNAVLLMEIMSNLGIPDYLHKKSNHLYSYRQKIVLLVIMERKKLSFRRFEEEADSFIPVFNAIGLDQCPHYSTLCRFRKEIDGRYLDMITMAFTAIVKSGAIVPIDSTSVANYDRSAHYMARIKQFGQKPIEIFTKASFAVDSETKVIIACEADAAKPHKHDIKDVPALVRKLKKSKVDMSCVVADKGYDSEAIHRLIERELDAPAFIPIRKVAHEIPGQKVRTKGIHRSLMKRVLVDGTREKKSYNRRAIVETVNFMFKTNMCKCISAKLYGTCETVVKLRAIGHNLLRIHRLNAYRTMGV